jgi:aspartate aminotransferase
MPIISKRAQAVPISPFRKLIPLADEAKAKGKHIYHLNIGQPDIKTPTEALDKLKATDISILEYSPSVGYDSYRKKMVGYYSNFDISVKAENIIITTGASEAIQFIFQACLNEGEEIVIPEPFYANYNGFAHMANIGIKPITTYIETGFALPSPELFESMIGPKTKGIMITNPNNPTGCLYPKETLIALGELVKKHDLYLFVDEVYREFCYDNQDFFSVLNIPGIEENVIVIDSISKRYSACGARIGGIVSRNKEVLESVRRYANLRLSPPGLGQILGEALVEMDNTYLEETKEEYDHRRNVVYSRLQKMEGVTSYLPGGAFYCFARFPIENAEDFCRWLLVDFEYKGASIMLSPGNAFYAHNDLGRNEVRIAYVLNEDKLNAAMDCLEQALISYQSIMEKKSLNEMNA